MADKKELTKPSRHPQPSTEAAPPAGPDKQPDQRFTLTPPLGAYPAAPPQPQGPFLPPPQHAAPQYGGYGTVGSGSGYGVTFGGAGGGAASMYAPPPYDQLAQHHQLSQQMPMAYNPAAAMYAAAASYPGYIGYPVQYYPYYPTAAVQPSIQPLRPTIMIPNGFEAGARFEGLSQPLLPPAPAPPAPHLAAMAHHQVLWR